MPLMYQAQVAPHGVVPRLPSRARAVPAAARRGLQHGLRRRRPISSELGLPLKAEYNVARHRAHDELLGLPSLKAARPAAEPDGHEPWNSTDYGPQHIRTRLAGLEGRAYWRSLEELADTPEFQRVRRARVPVAGLGVHRPGGPPAVPEVDGRVARPGRRQRVHAPAGREARSVRPAARGNHSGPSAVLRDRDDPGRLRACRCSPRTTWAGRPSSRATPSIRRASGATDIFSQASVLTLYDPDRSRTVVEPRRSRSLGRRSRRAPGGDRLAPARVGGAGLRMLTEPITSPSLLDQIQTLLRDDAAGEVASVGCRSTARARAARPASTALYHFDKADVVVSLDADFLGFGPGAVRYTKDFSSRRRIGTPTDEINRLYVVEPVPTMTGAQGRSSPARSRRATFMALPARSPAAVGVGRRRRCGGARPTRHAPKWITARRRRSAGAQGPLGRRRRRASAGRRARARARDERGARQRRHDRDLRRAARRLAGRRRRVDRRARRRHERGPGGRARHARRQPGVHGAGRSRTSAKRCDKVRPARAPRPLPRRDRRAVPLAHPRGALPRVVGRRARVRRHRLAHAAAHRAALRRAGRRSRSWRRSTASRAAADGSRQGVLDAGVRRPDDAGVDDADARGPAVRDRRRVLAPRAARRVRRGHVAPRPARAAVAAPAPRARSRPRRRSRRRDRGVRRHRQRCRPPAVRPARRASRSSSVPIRTSSTAASPTTAGCRSCRSRCRRSRGTTSRTSSARTAERARRRHATAIGDRTSRDRRQGRSARMPVWVMPGTADDVVAVHFGYGRRKTGRVGTGVGVDTFGLRTSKAPWFDGGAQVVRRRASVLRSRRRRTTSRWKGGTRCASSTREEYRANPKKSIEEQGPKSRRRRCSLYPGLRVQGPQVGHGDRPELLHGLPGLHRGLRRGEQHPGRRQGAGRAQPRDALDSRGHVLRGRSRTTPRASITSRCRASSARTRRARWSARSRRRCTATKA